MRKRSEQPNRQLRIATYQRCSTDDQKLGDFTTVDAQREINLRHVAALGGIHAGDYADEGMTGTNLRRPGYRSLVADAAAGKFDVVVCTYMSRLGRGDSFTIAKYELEQHSVRIELVQEKFSDDVAGYAQQQFTKLLDGMYPVQVRGWTITKMTEMFNKDYFVGGGIGFGYMTEPITDTPVSPDKEPPKRRVPNPDTAPLVAQAYEILLATRCVSDVLDYLTSTTGTQWTYRKGMYLLTSRTYLGEAKWRDMVRPGAHPAIVSVDAWQAVQEILSDNENRRRRNRAQKPDREAADPFAYHLRGFVFCGCCSGTGYGEQVRMTTKDAIGRRGPVRYYECLSIAKYRRRDCTVKRVNADALHTAIVEEIGLMAAHPWRIRRHIERAALTMPAPHGLEEQLRGVERRLKDADKRLANLSEVVARVGASAALTALITKINAVEGERATLAEQVRTLKTAIVAAKGWRPNTEQLQCALRDFTKIWPHLSTEDRSYVLPRFVSNVEMKERSIAEVLLLPALVEELRMPPRKIGGNSEARDLISASRQSPPRSHFAFGSRLPVLITVGRGRALEMVDA